MEVENQRDQNGIPLWKVPKHALNSCEQIAAFIVEKLVKHLKLGLPLLWWQPNRLLLKLERSNLYNLLRPKKHINLFFLSRRNSAAYLLTPIK